MRFLIDEQLPPALAAAIEARGHTAQHVRDAGLGGLSDDVIWQHASSTQAIIVTKDADFVFRQSLDPNGPPVVWVRLGNTRRAVLIAFLTRALPGLLAALERGDRLVQLTRTDAI